MRGKGMSLPAVRAMLTRLAARLYLSFLSIFVSPLWIVIEPSLSPILEDLQQKQSKARQALEQLWSYKWIALGAIATLAVVIFVLMISAVVSYLIGYKLFFTIPVQEHIEVPVFFHFDKKNSPSALIKFDEKLITKRQGYSLTLEMLLPEAPDNFDVGMFMASTQLSYEDSRNASHLISGAYSERPSSLRWRSELVRKLYTLTFALPLVFGVDLVEEKQKISLRLFDDAIFIPPSSGSIVRVEVNLSDPRIQVYEARLIVSANIYGLTYFVYHYFYTSLLIGSIVIFWFQLFGTVVLTAAGIAYWWKYVANVPSVGQGGGGGGNEGIGGGGGGKPVSPPAKKKKTEYSAGGKEIKIEYSEVGKYLQKGKQKERERPQESDDTEDEPGSKMKETEEGFELEDDLDDAVVETRSEKLAEKEPQKLDIISSTLPKSPKAEKGRGQTPATNTAIVTGQSQSPKSSNKQHATSSSLLSYPSKDSPSQSPSVDSKGNELRKRQVDSPKNATDAEVDSFKL